MHPPKVDRIHDRHRRGAPMNRRLMWLLVAVVALGTVAPSRGSEGVSMTRVALLPKRRTGVEAPFVESVPGGGADFADSAGQFIDGYRGLDGRPGAHRLRRGCRCRAGSRGPFRPRPSPARSSFPAVRSTTRTATRPWPPARPSKTRHARHGILRPWRHRDTRVEEIDQYPPHTVGQEGSPPTLPGIRPP